MSRASRGPDKLRPLHLPSPVRVRTDEEGRPTAVATSPVSRDGSPWQRVVQIREIWRIDDEWWREPVSRLYVDAVLENGRTLVLYRDLIRGGWYVQGGKRGPSARPG